MLREARTFEIIIESFKSLKYLKDKRKQILFCLHPHSTAAFSQPGRQQVNFLRKELEQPARPVGKYLSVLKSILRNNFQSLRT